MIIRNWNGREIDVEASRGGVLATVDYEDNLVCVECETWPHPLLKQKLRSSKHQGAFEPVSRERLAATLGFYCDLQSLSSEDAVTWSFFAPLLLSEDNVRVEFLNNLLERTNIDCTCDACDIILWQRILHPEKRGARGPEVDFILRGDRCVILGEAKWNSLEAQGQGVGRNKSQIELRKDFFAKHGEEVYGARQFVVMALQRDGSSAICRNETCDGIVTRTVCWEDLLRDVAHPKADELKRYCQWKAKYAVRR